MLVQFFAIPMHVAKIQLLLPFHESRFVVQKHGHKYMCSEPNFRRTVITDCSIYSQGLHGNLAVLTEKDLFLRT